MITKGSLDDNQQKLNLSGLMCIMERWWDILKREKKVEKLLL